MAYTNCDLVLSVKDADDRDEWLKVRNMGIGGSDASVIMGLNSYKSPYQLWLEKIGEAAPEDLTGNPFVYWGQKNEANIADWFNEETGKKVQRLGTLRNKDYPFMIANVDRTVIGENAGLEIKTAGVSQYKKWKGDEIPDAYYCQCLHYMAVTGADYWYIAVLLGGNEARWKKIERNEEDIKVLIEKEKEFWNLVETKTPPPVDGSKSCATALGIYFKEDKGSEMVLPDEALPLIESVKLDKETINKLKENIQLKENQLAEIMGNYETGRIGDYKVTFKTSTPRESISISKVKKADPGSYEALKAMGLVTLSKASRTLRVW